MIFEETNSIDSEYLIELLAADKSTVIAVSGKVKP